jgi:hypothetical protein
MKLARWNEYVPVEDDETALIKTRLDSGSMESAGSNTVGPTRLFSHTMDKLALFILPFGIAAGLCAPGREIRRRVRSNAATSGSFIVFEDQFADQWILHDEIVTSDQVNELKRIWSLPYPGPVEFDFRVSD